MKDDRIMRELLEQRKITNKLLALVIYPPELQKSFDDEFALLYDRLVNTVNGHLLEGEEPQKLDDNFYFKVTEMHKKYAIEELAAPNKSEDK